MDTRSRHPENPTPRQERPFVAQGSPYHPSTQASAEPFEADSNAIPFYPQTNWNTPPEGNRLSSQKSQLRKTARTLWLVVFLPVVSGLYLAFCYSTQWHTFVIKKSWIDPSVSQSTTVKTGVTSISILIVTLALLPVYSLVSDIRSEEFFRVLSTRTEGVALDAVNEISLPSYGFLDQLKGIIRRQTSAFLTSAFFATLVVLCASTLAPAILSAEPAQTDNGVVAVRVGAVLKNTVVNSSEHAYTPYLNSISFRGYQVSSLPWVENVLGATYKWSSQAGNATNFLAIPTPLDIEMGIPIRYLTDIMVLAPSCKWVAGEFVIGQELLNNGTVVNITLVNLPDITPEGIRIDFTPFMASLLNPYSFGMAMATSDYYTRHRGKLDFQGDWYPFVDGSTAWAIAKCDQSKQLPGVACPRVPSDPTRVTQLDLGSIPISSNSRLGSSSVAWDTTFLVCSPNLRVETREVSINRNNSIIVREATSSSKVYKRQRNLDEAQSRILVEQAINAISITSGPSSLFLADQSYSLGGVSQVHIVFGRDVAAALTLQGQTITPLPIDQITRNYGMAVQSLMKMFLDGSVASRYVPGRLVKSAFILSSSLPHIIASTILFVGLTIFLIVCHFRSSVPRFTLVSVAASLADSECPDVMKDKQLRGTCDEVNPEEDILASLAGRQIAVEGRPGRTRATLRMPYNNNF